MPLVFDSPESVSIDAAKIVALSINLEPSFSIVVHYVSGPESNGVIQPVSGGVHSFSQDEYAEVDAGGDTYEAVKKAAYELLEKRLGSGQIA